MFDRIINILIVEHDEQACSSLLAVIQKQGHNVFVAKSEREAFSLIEEKNFVLIFCSLDLPNLNKNEFLKTLHRKNASKNSTVIATSSNQNLLYSVVGADQASMAMDYLMKPFVPNLVQAKISVYKKLYFKHQRVSRLLESILPAQTLNEFSIYGKSSPKKKENCAVIFTDFVNFTQKTKGSDPQELVKKLDFYFSKFDAIILKYKLEKIKTIGDAYMAVGGVTEEDPNPLIRTALAAIEIRNYMLNDMLTAKALNRDFWEIRIGIHSGGLVAGVVGKHKFSFDIWGDTVNIAARCEQNSVPGQINISETFHEQIKGYFDCTSRGEIEIKNGGKIGMFFLDRIKPDFSLYHQGRTPNIELRKAAGLPLADFEGLRSFIMNKLKAELHENLLYHSWEHTQTVEEAVIKYAELEKLSDHDLFLVRTAALFHDTGFLFRYHDNETLAVELFSYHAPKFGYQPDDIARINAIISATAIGAKPQNLAEAVMCDADLDYLGRLDYHVTAGKLFDEMELYGEKITRKERIEIQIDYLENRHQYYTTSAINLRDPGKKRRIVELKKRLATFATA